MSVDNALGGLGLRMQSILRNPRKIFDPAVELQYKNSKIAWDDWSFYANEKIDAGEKIFEDDSLWSFYGDDEMVTGFTVIAKPIRGNVRFSDESTVYAIKDIDKEEKIVFTYPEWYRPSLFMASNKFVYALIQIFVVIVLIVVVFTVMYIWMTYKK